MIQRGGAGLHGCGRRFVLVDLRALFWEWVCTDGYGGSTTVGVRRYMEVSTIEVEWMRWLLGIFPDHELFIRKLRLLSHPR